MDSETASWTLEIHDDSQHVLRDTVFAEFNPISNRWLVDLSTTCGPCHAKAVVIGVDEEALQRVEHGMASESSTVGRWVAKMWMCQWDGRLQCRLGVICSTWSAVSTTHQLRRGCSWICLMALGSYYCPRLLTDPQSTSIRHFQLLSPLLTQPLLWINYLCEPFPSGPLNQFWINDNETVYNHISQTNWPHDSGT